MKSVLLLGSCLGLCLAAPFTTTASSAASQRFPRLSLTNITSSSLSDLDGRALSGPSGFDFPDPSIIGADGTWYAYGTSSNGREIPVATSSDGLSWSLQDVDALPDPGPWVSSSDRSIWAPDVQRNDAGTFVMYYTAARQGATHCIGVATSASPQGPFSPSSSPLICDDAGGGVIDASGYDDGTDRWIFWKVDGNSLGGATTCQGGAPSGSAYTPTPIRIQKLARDAVTLLGDAKTILDNEGASNDGVVEAPSLYQVPGGDFVLFYSAHCYASDDYDIEYAWSSTIDGSYGSRGVLLRTADNRGIFAPGGLDIDPNGRNVVFHGRLAAGQGGGGARKLYGGTIQFGSMDASI